MVEAVLTRRDLLEACKLAKIGLDRLEDSAEGQLALAYIAEKKSGAVDAAVTFDEWLDTDLAEVTVGDEEPADPS